MLVSYVEERHVKSVMHNRFYRWLFFTYTKHLDLKNILIRYETEQIIKRKYLAIPRVLDVGFGFGQRIFYLLSKYPKAGVLGIDISDKAVSYANKYFNQAENPNVYCMKKDVMDLDDNASFDIAYAVKALNYIEDDKIALKKVYESLKPNGTLLLLNSHSTKSQHEIIYDRIYSLPMFRDGYSLDKLEDMVKEAGFSKVEARYVYGFTGNLAWKIVVAFPIKSVRISRLFIPLLPIYMLLAAPIAGILNFYEFYIGHTMGRSIFIKAEK
ncbi:MAG: class I SAM-dependent methyltransferase [Bacteroidia bacterium]|nr:class I SAM-dependent methyltransferase [Bacteroidia bacterium]MCO5254737.1 class I SAM-dependent methyltransferase [Bacteroidota bacterium]